MWSIRRRGSKSQQRAQQRRTVRQTRSGFVDDLHLLAFEHYDVRILAKTIQPPVLNNEQPRFHVFENETETRNDARRSPNAQLLAERPHAQMYFRTFNRGREAYTIAPGDRIAQLVVLPIVRATLQVVDTFDASARGEGGFGHTGLR